jgi:hypothetical protein
LRMAGHHPVVPAIRNVRQGSGDRRRSFHHQSRAITSITRFRFGRTLSVEEKVTRPPPGDSRLHVHQLVPAGVFSAISSLGAMPSALPPIFLTDEDDCPAIRIDHTVNAQTSDPSHLVLESAIARGQHRTVFVRLIAHESQIGHPHFRVARGAACHVIAGRCGDRPPAIYLTARCAGLFKWPEDLAPPLSLSLKPDHQSPIQSLRLEWRDTRTRAISQPSGQKVEGGS